jgi:hypothetical protein
MDVSLGKRDREKHALTHCHEEDLSDSAMAKI